MYEHLIVKEQGRLAEIHLHRPSVRHALSRALMREITACARDLSDRTDIDVVILTGDARCFSAGADLKDANAWADDSLSTVQRRDIAGTTFFVDPALDLYAVLMIQAPNQRDYYRPLFRDLVYAALV